MRNPFAKTRLVLVIGDDGALLVQVAGKQARDAWFVAADDPEGPAALARFFAAQRTAPVTVLVDTLEQIYREETLPKVNVLDRGKVLRRRIEMAFPSDPMRAALPVRRTNGTGSAYLLTALPLSGWLSRWLAFLESLSNPFDGFSLLPLESLKLARTLAAVPATTPRRQWYALVSLHVTGGFRQVIETSDRLIVTRLTQPPVEGTPPAEVAAQIEREFRSTLTYIKRMGYVDGDELDIVVLADAAVVEAIQDVGLPATRLTTLTPKEAGARLGLKHVADTDSGYADVLQAVWAMTQRKRRLVLRTPAMQHRRTMAMASRWTGRAAALATIGIAGLAAYGHMQNDALAQRIEAAQARLAAANTEATQVERGLKALPIGLADIKSVVDVYRDIGARTLALPPFLAAVADALGDDARLNGINLSVQNKAAPIAARGARRPPPASATATGAAVGGGPQTPPGQAVDTQLLVRFLTPASDPRQAVDAAYALLERLRVALPNYDVQAVRLPVAVLPGESLQGVLVAEASSAGSGRTAEYLIKERDR